MIDDIFNATLAAGESASSGWRILWDYFNHHGMNLLITGSGTVSVQVKTAPTPDDTCDTVDDEPFSNVSAGKYFSILELNPNHAYNAFFTNNSPFSVSVRAWVSQTGRGK